MKEPFRLTNEQQSQLVYLVLHPNITAIHVLNVRDILLADDPIQAEQYIHYLTRRLGAGRRYFQRFPQLTP